MGLDMYLKRGKKIPGRDFNHIKKLNELVCEYGDESVKEAYKDFILECGQHFKWYSFFEEVCYWRKANQIHNWFVNNVQDGIDDCDYYEVSKEQIEELRDICVEVLNSLKNSGKTTKNVLCGWENGKEKYVEVEAFTDIEVAESLLPRHSGFFFESYDYDEWYLEDLKHTVEEFEKILEEFDFDNNYLVYTSSW